ncbi:MAG: hypothetical protein JXA21_13800 [Anaerolineae bacterium]|nr:hypothetical protein [Anaerolineae bacterium]
MGVGQGVRVGVAVAVGAGVRVAVGETAAALVAEGAAVVVATGVVDPAHDTQLQTIPKSKIFKAKCFNRRLNIVSLLAKTLKYSHSTTILFHKVRGRVP